MSDRDLNSKVLSKLPDRTRILLEVATDKYEVGLALLEDLLPKCTRSDTTNHADDELFAECGLDRLGELSVERSLDHRGQLLF